MDSLAIVFLKYPEAGRVKTRLAVEIGPYLAALVYRRCAEYFLENLRSALPPEVPVRLAYEPANKEALFRQWLPGAYEWTPQPYGNPGRRLRQICRAATNEGKRRVLLLGSDSPTLRPGLFRQAFAALEKEDAVVGPAAGGGCYLIGFSRPAESVFPKVDWSGPQVFDQILARLHALQLSYERLPEHYTILAVRDLLRLKEELGALPPAGRAGRLLDAVLLALRDFGPRAGAVASPEAAVPSGRGL